MKSLQLLKKYVKNTSPSNNKRVLFAIAFALFFMLNSFSQEQKTLPFLTNYLNKTPKSTISLPKVDSIYFYRKGRKTAIAFENKGNYSLVTSGRSISATQSPFHQLKKNSKGWRLEQLVYDTNPFQKKGVDFPEKFSYKVTKAYMKEGKQTTDVTVQIIKTFSYKNTSVTKKKVYKNDETLILFLEDWGNWRGQGHEFRIRLYSTVANAMLVSTYFLTKQDKLNRSFIVPDLKITNYELIKDNLKIAFDKFIFMGYPSYIEKNLMNTLKELGY